MINKRGPVEEVEDEIKTITQIGRQVLKTQDWMQQPIN